MMTTYYDRIFCCYSPSFIQLRCRHKTFPIRVISLFQHFFFFVLFDFSFCLILVWHIHKQRSGRDLLSDYVLFFFIFSSFTLFTIIIIMIVISVLNVN